MPIHTSATRLQALFSRTLQRVPPRTRTRPQIQIQRLLLPPPQAANNHHHRMSSTSYPAPAPAGSSPAPGSSTSPRPGNAPSATNADASGGAAPAAPPAAATVESTETTTTPNESHSNSAPKKPLALPATTEPSSPENEKTTTISVNGAPVALDALGPMVIGRDGSVSRIANWHEMVEHEKQATLRVLGKRNQLRLGALREAMDANSRPEGGSS